MRDELVRPDARGDAGHHGALGFGVVVFCQFGGVGDEFHHVAQLGRCSLDGFDGGFCLRELRFAVDASHAGLGDPFAGDVVRFDLGFESVPVAELEEADFWVVGVFEEDGLAVASVLERGV